MAIFYLKRWVVLCPVSSDEARGESMIVVAALLFFTAILAINLGFGVGVVGIFGSAIWRPFAEMSTSLRRWTARAWGSSPESA